MSPSTSVLSRLDAVRQPLSLRDLWRFDVYAAARPALVRQLIAMKRARRVALGAHCSLVFESRASVWFQIQEELYLQSSDWSARAARLLAQYAGLVPDRGGLRASLFLECSEPSLARELSLLFAEHIERLCLHLPWGCFRARPLESLADGIPGVAFLRFGCIDSVPARRLPSLHWSVPDCAVASVLAPDVVDGIGRLLS